MKEKPNTLNKCMGIRKSKGRSSSAEFLADLQGLYREKGMAHIKVLPNSKVKNLNKRVISGVLNTCNHFSNKA